MADPHAEARDGAVDPRVVYDLSKTFARAVQEFVAEHAEEWDGGGTGYRAAELHAMAEEILDAIEAAGD